MGFSTRHHHLTRPLSSRTCLPAFSTLPGKRYWDWERAKRLRTKGTRGRWRASTRKDMKAAVTSRMGLGAPRGRSRRDRYPVESALATKMVVDLAVV